MTRNQRKVYAANTVQVDDRMRPKADRATSRPTVSLRYHFVFKKSTFACMQENVSK